MVQRWWKSRDKPLKDTPFIWPLHRTNHRFVVHCVAIHFSFGSNCKSFPTLVWQAENSMDDIEDIWIADYRIGTAATQLPYPELASFVADDRFLFFPKVRVVFGQGSGALLQCLAYDKREHFAVLDFRRSGGGLIYEGRSAAKIGRIISVVEEIRGWKRKGSPDEQGEWQKLKFHFERLCRQKWREKWLNRGEKSECICSPCNRVGECDDLAISSGPWEPLLNVLCT